MYEAQQRLVHHHHHHHHRHLFVQQYNSANMYIYATEKSRTYFDTDLAVLLFHMR